jgi:branched-chain amino acid transport system permease protein
VVGILLTGLFGIIQQKILSPLADMDLRLMLCGTIGLGIVLDNTAIVLWGAEGFAVPLKSASTSMEIGPMVIVPHQITIFFVAVALMVALELFLKRTKIGKGMRAAACARYVAGSMGVNVDMANMITFAIGAGLASAAGCLAAPIVYVNPAMSAAVGVKGMAAAVLGGFGNIRGAVLGGLAFGVMEAVATAYMSSAYKDGLAFATMAAVLMFLPNGLLGEETVQKV